MCVFATVMRRFIWRQAKQRNVFSYWAHRFYEWGKIWEEWEKKKSQFLTLQVMPKSPHTSMREARFTRSQTETRDCRKWMKYFNSAISNTTTRLIHSTFTAEHSRAGLCLSFLKQQLKQFCWFESGRSEACNLSDIKVWVQKLKRITTFFTSIFYTWFLSLLLFQP